MHVSLIHLSNFMRHTVTDLELPARGVMVVTGDNGAGKSSFIEGVAAAVWGKSLRSAEPWIAGTAGTVKVVTDLATVTRACSAKGTKKLAWEVPGQMLVKFDTTTKAQLDLEALVGDFDTWRRTHVFSSSDAAHFSSATDGERKRLIEHLIGLEVFDAALERATGELRRLQASHQELEVKHARASGRVHTLVSTGQILRAQVSQPEPTEPTPHDPELMKQLDALLESYKATRADMHLRHQEIHMRDMPAARAEAEAYGVLQAQKRALATMKAGAVCTTCKRPFEAHDADAVGRLEAALQDAVAEHARLSAAAQQEALEHREERKQIDDELNELDRQRHTTLETQRVQQQLRSRHDDFRALHAEWSKTRARQQAQLAEHDAQLAAAEREVDGLVEAMAEVAEDIAYIEAARKVLGLRGARGHVLARALEGIEAVANVWLGRISGENLQLELKSYGTNKDGGMKDAIAMEVHGAGGGYGYKAASGGERRRIDAALLLALAEVSAASRSSEPGTLFFDEVFDALDTRGQEAVSETLADLALDRAVVVITHSPSLAARIPAVRRVHVTNGGIR